MRWNIRFRSNSFWKITFWKLLTTKINKQKFDRQFFDVPLPKSECLHISQMWSNIKCRGSFFNTLHIDQFCDVGFPDENFTDEIKNTRKIVNDFRLICILFRLKTKLYHYRIISIKYYEIGFDAKMNIMNILWILTKMNIMRISQNADNANKSTAIVVIILLSKSKHRNQHVWEIMKEKAPIRMNTNSYVMHNILPLQNKILL